MSDEYQHSSPHPKALVVHRDASVRSELCKLLTFADFSPEQSCCVDDARLLVTNQPFDLVVVETVGFPNSSRDAQALVSLIRELPHYEFVPVVSVSDNPLEAQRAAELGSDLFVPLPLDRRVFTQEVTQLYRRFVELQRRVSDEQHKFRQKILRTLSHEFRTPLVGILVGIELLEDAEELVASPKLRRILDAVKVSTERLSSAVMDFLLCQQIEAGAAARSFEVNKRSVSVSSLVMQYIESNRVSLEERGFVLSAEIDHGNPLILAYDQQIVSVLERLLSNAVKFSPERKEIQIIVAANGSDGVSVRICDRGIGIGKDGDAALVPFSQPGRERYEQQGCGLGLAVADGLARINGGQLRLSPRDGGGTIVELLFDCVASDS